MFTAALILVGLLGSFDGTYQRPCNLVDTDALSSRLQVTGNEWTVAHTAYEEEQCQKPYLTYEVKYKVKAVNDHDIDMTAQEAFYVLHSDEIAESLNYIHYCGFTDWQKGVKKVVTGLTCDEFQAPVSGEVTYSIANLNEKNELRLGEASGNNRGKTPATRHQKLESLPFLKSE